MLIGVSFAAFGSVENCSQIQNDIVLVFDILVFKVKTRD
jgi:hypothetical protein